MKTEKAIVEIYEGDPFKGCCGPGVATEEDVKKMRMMLIERNEIVKTLREEFKDKIEIERDVISSRRPLNTYPRQVQRLLSAGVRVPFVIIDGELAIEGRFPSLEEFRRIVNEYVGKRCQRVDIG